MELMAPVLLCALLTLLPRALGENRIAQFTKIYNESELNNHMKEKSTRSIMQKKLLLNMNGIPLVTNPSPLQSVFMDAKCYPCTACMKKAINSFRSPRHYDGNIPHRINQDFDTMSEENYVKRYKRDQINALKTKKPKSKKMKRSQTQNSVMVTKYMRDGDVYALKVQEMETKNTTCHVYRVRKSYVCDSQEADLVMALAKKRNKKGSKRETASTMTTTQSTTTTQNIDNSQVAQDSFMPSIELY